MRDAIGGLIGRYDQLGRYLDRSAIDSIETYLDESSLRIQAVELINREAAEIVREASQRLFRDEPELLLPGGNAYTTRRLAACLRDMDYFLRYASYEGLHRWLTSKQRDSQLCKLDTIIGKKSTDTIRNEVSESDSAAQRCWYHRIHHRRPSLCDLRRSGSCGFSYRISSTLTSLQTTRLAWSAVLCTLAA